MEALRRLINPLQQRVMLMVSRAVVLLAKDSTSLQTLQVSLLADEVRSDVERFQNYGFSSHPHPGAEAVAVSVGGSRDHVLVIAVDDRRYRLASLAEGEVAIYTDEGDSIVIKRGGTIEVTAATKVRIVSPLVECTGNLHVIGNVTVDGTAHVAGDITSGTAITAATDIADQAGAKTMAGMRTVFNAHKNGASALSTGPM